MIIHLIQIKKIFKYNKYFSSRIFHYFYYSSSNNFYWGGWAGFFTTGYFLVWLRMNIALSLYFLLINTESSFFRSFRIEIVSTLKLGMAVRGFPWMVNVLRCSKCFTFSSSDKSEMKLQWRYKVFRPLKC